MAFPEPPEFQTAAGPAVAPEELQRQIACLRRLRPWLWVLALPGIDFIAAGVLRAPRPAVRWMLRTGYDHLLATYGTVAEDTFEDDAKLIAWLRQAHPPPPPEVWQLMDRMGARRSTSTDE